MAASELIGRMGMRRNRPAVRSAAANRVWQFPEGLQLAWLKAYGATWAVTVLAATLVAIDGRPAISLTRDALGLRLKAHGNPPPHLAGVLALAAHNLPIAAWPVLIGLTGADRHKLSRHLSDFAVLVCIVLNCAPVGAALAAYGSAVIAYLPQLPVEWAGLALGASSWLVQRRRSLSSAERLLWLGMTTGVLLGAAALETFAVPHR
jgi:hypothetical protein